MSGRPLSGSPGNFGGKCRGVCDTFLPASGHTDVTARFSSRSWESDVSNHLRQATFWLTYDPAASSSDFLASLRASGLVMRHSGVAACQRPRQATFWRRWEPAASSSDFLVSLRASGSVKRLFGVAACQRPRQATFWCRCVPAASSCDILESLRASGAVMRHFGKPACQRRRHATF